MEHSQERKYSQQCQRQSQLEQYFKTKDPEGTVIRQTQEKGSTSISKKRAAAAKQNQPSCKKQALVGNVGSGTEELDRLIADDQNQIDEGRMIGKCAPQLQYNYKRLRPADSTHLASYKKAQKRVKKVQIGG